MDYAVVNVLGRGEQGTVYLALELPAHRLVTIKVLSAVSDADATIERLRRDQPAWATLSSLNIAGPIATGLTAGGQPYVIREYVRGAPITTHCERFHCDRSTKERFLADVSAVIGVAHDRQIAHGGLSPSNVFVVQSNGEYAPKVMDCGLRPATPAEDLAALNDLASALL